VVKTFSNPLPANDLQGIGFLRTADLMITGDRSTTDLATGGCRGKRRASSARGLPCGTRAQSTIRIAATAVNSTVRVSASTVALLQPAGWQRP
jgi:hypothetical protein